MKSRYMGTSLSHPHNFQLMKPKPGTSSVLHNPSIDDIMDRRVLYTLAVIPEGKTFQPIWDFLQPFIYFSFYATPVRNL